MLNHITAMGRLTRDPELRRTGSGIAVASFSIACDRDFPDKSTGQRETDFLDCVAWRHTGEFVSRNFKKGAQICVSGRLQIRSWTDNNGAKRRSAEINVENAYFAGSRSDASPYPPVGTGLPDGPYPASSAPVGADAHIGPNTAYPETEAMLRAYGVPPESDYAMLTDDDTQLPF